MVKNIFVNIVYSAYLTQKFHFKKGLAINHTKSVLLPEENESLIFKVFKDQKKNRSQYIVTVNAL